MTVFFSRDESVQRLKEMADIVQIIGEHVRLQKRGVNYKGLCPFHAEKTPSFTVNPVRRSFHCFGCGEGGDIFSFLMLYHRLTFPEALKELADRYQVELPQPETSAADQARARKRQSLYQLQEKAARIYHDFLKKDPAAEPARRYLRERAIPDEIIDRFLLGYAPDRWDFLVTKLGSSALAEEAGLLARKERGHYDRFRGRILFPIRDLTGKHIGFGGRILGEGQPKYLNSPETPIFEKGRTLFGLYENREAIRRSRQCLIVEGNFDLLSLVASDVGNVVAPLGTALTQNQVRMLKGFTEEALLFFDGDAAGYKAAMRAVPLFLAEQLMAKVAVLPARHDPDTYVRERGKDGLQALLAAALPLSDFVFQHLADKFGLGLEGKGRIVSELQPLLQAVPEGVQQALFASHFAEKLGLPSDQLLGGRAGRPARLAASPKEREKAAAPASLTLRQKELLEFVIFHPQFAAEFLAAGLEEHLVRFVSPDLLQHLRALALEPEAQPERLLEMLEPGRERTLVSELLVSACASGEEVPAAEKARLLLGCWQKPHLRSRKESLLQQIDQALHAKDDALYLDLMGKLQEVDRRLAS